MGAVISADSVGGNGRCRFFSLLFLLAACSEGAPGEDGSRDFRSTPGAHREEPEDTGAISGSGDSGPLEPGPRLGDEPEDSWKPREVVLEAAFARLGALVRAESEGPESSVAGERLIAPSLLPAAYGESGQLLWLSERWAQAHDLVVCLRLASAGRPAPAPLHVGLLEARLREPWRLQESAAQLAETDLLLTDAFLGLAGQPTWSEELARALREATEGEGTAMALQAFHPRPTVPATPTEQAENPLQPGRWEAYLAQRAKAITDLQPWRQEQTLEVETTSGPAHAVLVDLAPATNAWFLISLDTASGEQLGSWHLENRDPGGTRLSLEAAWQDGLTLRREGEASRCALWSGPAPSALERARIAGRPYEDLCEGRIALRNPAEGRKTRLEWATDFLRDRVPAGEKITVFVRDEILADAHRITPETSHAEEPALATRPPPPGAPAQLRLAEGSRDVLLVPVDLGLPLEGLHEQRAIGGAWYAVTGHEGVFLAALQPGLLATAEDTPWEDRLDPLDAYERDALVYLVAFNLARFDLHYELGTDHPRLGWSERVLPEMVEAGLGGPDGVADAKPLVATGKVDPTLFPRLEATFTGGFKRSHGAFKQGPLAHSHQGTHYGFMEQGVILSRLQPGLTTLLVAVDGRVDLRRWQATDDEVLPTLRDARQNGLPLVEPDPATGAPAPGQKVTAWAEGNWSGSVDGRLRSLRAGVCLQESEGRRYLIYGWFSSATPSAMARVFLASGCRDAMLMDMNALEHTYLALYRDQDGVPLPEHLSTGMDVLDKLQGETVLPRFASFSDNRDFFYLLRRSDP